MNIPTILTILRIALIPVLALVFYLPSPWSNITATATFILAALTDWFDGYLARRFNQTTPLGAFLDPVADKLIVAVVLVLLTESYATPWIALPAAIIIGREITISALREWMAELGQRSQVAVSRIGKIKTTAQMIALPVLLYREPLFGLPITQIGYVALYIAAILTLWSMSLYLLAAFPILRKEKQK
ncbi:MAG: CDP-diacylglycerol--glycerol-3-phosphate 3-phosphatidyltransferase [Gammaproteobacteria bacterium]|nr:CDP-diacylglycerol--glycerol-3-phosphate 3-phosphatidyltransferase [Gammaproteobacteria bacterium]